MEFNFPKKEGTGIVKLMPHVSADIQEIIVKLLEYNADNRLSASQALKSACFKEFREADKSFQEPQSQVNSIMRLTQRPAESKRYLLELNVYSMTKISDNVSEGNYS